MPNPSQFLLKMGSRGPPTGSDTLGLGVQGAYLLGQPGDCNIAALQAIVAGKLSQHVHL